MLYQFHKTVHMLKKGSITNPSCIFQMSNPLHTGLLREDVELSTVLQIQKIVEYKFLPPFSQRTLILTTIHGLECFCRSPRIQQRSSSTNSEKKKKKSKRLRVTVFFCSSLSPKLAQLSDKRNLSSLFLQTGDREYI